MNILKASARLVFQSFAAVRGRVPAALLPAVLLAPLAESATDTPPNRMTVQSYITDDTGTPLGSTTAVNKKMVFIVYTADTGGTVKFADEQIVTVDNGHFSVVLGEGSPVGDESHDLASAFVGEDASDRFIEIQVSDTDGSSPQTLSPRLRLLPAAYAFLSSYANEAARVTGGGVDTAAISDSAVNSAKVANESLTVFDLGPNSVGSSEVIDNSLTAADLAADSVGNSELADNITLTGNAAVNQWWPNVTLGLKSVNTSDYLIYGVNSAGTLNLSVNSAGTLYARGGLASNMVNSSTVSDNSLTANDLAPNSVGSSELASNSVYAAEIAANQVGSSEIAPNITMSGNIGVNQAYSNVTFNVRGIADDFYAMTVENSGATKLFTVWTTGIVQTLLGNVIASDRRLKEEIQPLDNLLEGALRLQPVSYRLKAMPDIPAQIGFVAQDVQEIFPMAVMQGEDSLALSYSQFGVIAIGAIKELNAKVESLESKNAALHERLTALEALVQSLAE